MNWEAGEVAADIFRQGLHRKVATAGLFAQRHQDDGVKILDIKTGATQIEAVRLGSLGINGTTGSIYLDEFEIWR